MMQQVPPERRRRLLQRSGFVIENDSVALDNNIRQHREMCGCTCPGICYPDTCACYINGIGCQVSDAALTVELEIGSHVPTF